jgi:hypothetical protein
MQCSSIVATNDIVMPFAIPVISQIRGREKLGRKTINPSLCYATSYDVEVAKKTLNSEIY